MCDVILISEEEFDERYTLVPNDLNAGAAWDGCLFDTHGPEYEFVCANTNKVWTLIDEDGETVVESGLHWVNRLGYLVSHEPVPDGVFISVNLR